MLADAAAAAKCEVQGDLTLIKNTRYQGMAEEGFICLGEKTQTKTKKNISSEGH